MKASCTRISSGGFGQPGEGEVLPDELGVAARFFDADGAGRAAAETFQTQRARPGKNFQHSRVRNARAEAVEDCLPDQVRRGPDVKALGDLEDRAGRAAADDAHFMKRLGELAKICIHIRHSRFACNHELDQVGHAAAIAPFVVVPTDQFEKALVQLDAGTGVKNRGKACSE